MNLSSYIKNALLHFSKPWSKNAYFRYPAGILIGCVIVFLTMQTISIAEDNSNSNSSGIPQKNIHTMKDLYNRLINGSQENNLQTQTDNSKPEIPDIDIVIQKAPASDNNNGTQPKDVLSGTKYWGLRTDGEGWGPQTGTMEINNLSPTSLNVKPGYYKKTKLSKVDPDLKSNNIRKGVSIFGVKGAYPYAPVEKTGQKKKYEKHDDGDLKAGVPCNGPRFTDNTDGTVSDNLTGLIWLRTANCFGTKNWTSALSNVNNLGQGKCGLKDKSKQGDWRLPNVKELSSLIDFAFFNPALSNSKGTDKWKDGDPMIGVKSGSYWTSTTAIYREDFAWSVYLGNGYIFNEDKTKFSYVWPVKNDK